MYQFSYAEVLDETPKGARERERQAIDRSIELLREAEAQGVRSRAAIEAILFVRRLWGYLIEDLARPDNDLPQKLRADLISIGLWMMREAEQIRLEASSNFKGLIDVSTAIRDDSPPPRSTGDQPCKSHPPRAARPNPQPRLRQPRRTRARICSTTIRSCSC